MNSKKSLNLKPLTFIFYIGDTFPNHYNCVNSLTYWHCFLSLFLLPCSLFELTTFCKDNPDFNLALLIPSLIVGTQLLGVFPLLLEPTRFNLFKSFLKSLVKQIPALFLACLPAIVGGYLCPTPQHYTPYLPLAEQEWRVILEMVVGSIVLPIYPIVTYRGLLILEGEDKAYGGVEPRFLW